MTNPLHAFDVDGALRDQEEIVGADSRAGFFRKAGVLLGGAAFLGAYPTAALAQGVSKSDKEILNYALTLEYLEAAFYDKAIADGELRGDDLRFAKVVAAHENAHVDALKKTLGDDAVKKPSFDFKGTTGSTATFRATAQTLEDTGVSAYQGQATNIKAEAVLKAAASILPIEARHAAWIRNIADQPPAPDSFNPALSMQEVLSAVAGTGFIPGLSPAAAANAVPGSPTVAG